MDHHAPDRPRGTDWRAPLVFIGFAAIAAYFLLSEHRLHALSLAPWILILLACPLMHLFMHGGHGGHGSGSARPDADPDDSSAGSGTHQHHH